MVCLVGVIICLVVETVCCMDRTTGGQTAPDDDQVTMVATQGVLSGNIHVADECVHSLHGSLCHLWVCHWPQDVHKEQLGGSGTHPACAQAELTWCPHVDVTCTCSLTSHACCKASPQVDIHKGVTCCYLVLCFADCGDMH